MKFFVFFICLVFATKQNTESIDERSGQDNFFDKSAENPILVKIEEDEYDKVKKFSSEYVGVRYHKNAERWLAQRKSKNEKKMVYNGSYKDEETAAHASDTLARKLMKNSESHHKLNFPDDDTEFYPEEKSTTSKYTGVSYNETQARWAAYRRSRNERKTVSNGVYKDEETAAHASDTLARTLMANGEHHKLNFPDDDTEVNKEKKTKSSVYIGVIYNEERSKWQAQRRSRNGNNNLYNGIYKDEETAAHASDTLARKLMANGKQNFKLNFPDDDTEMFPEKTTTSKYIGVSHNEQTSRWQAQRWSKNEKKTVHNGTYKDEETAAHASDTLARELMENGEHYKLNFPDDDTEVYPERRKNKRRRPDDLGISQTDEKFEGNKYGQNFKN